MRSLRLKFARQPRDPHVGWLQIAAYGGVNLPVAILHEPVLSVLPALYAEVAHIDLVTIGAILAATRIGDAVLDPAIGVLSDRIDTPWGRRKPWIVFGALVCALAAFFLFRPGPATGAVYFAAGYSALYLGWTLVEIPHTAWASDMTVDGAQRTRLFASRNFMGALGGVIFMAIPLLPIWPSTRITPATMAVSSWVVILLLAPLTFAAVVFVPREAQAMRRTGFFAALRAMTRSRLFRRYLLISGAPGLASGMVAGLYYFYIDIYLKAGAGFAMIGLLVAAIGIVATPLWPPVIQRIGERRTIALFSLSTIAVLVTLLFDHPGPLGLPVVLAAFAISALFGAGLDTALATLLSEIVDRDMATTGGDRASGGYFAAQAFLSKVTLAAGGGLSLVVVGLFGFRPVQSNGPLAITGFFSAFIAAPLVLHAITVPLAWTFPAAGSAQSITSIRRE